MFWITALTWPAIVTAITRAAGAAGANGLVVIVSGHRASGLCNFDWTEPRGTKRSWNPQHVGKGLFFNDEVVTYTDRIPFNNPPTLKEKDEIDIKNKTVDW